MVQGLDLFLGFFNPITSRFDHNLLVLNLHFGIHQLDRLVFDMREQTLQRK